jgi:outer membrane protein OmpA-like peptidoglycan-associated protein
MTHSAPPSFPDCPQVENLNAQNEFQQGDSIYFGSYYRDQQAGVMSIYRIVQPDSSVFTEWQHSSDSTYIANYWGWWHQLPDDAQTGDWQFLIDFLDKTYEHIFHVEESDHKSENGEFISKPPTSQIPEVSIEIITFPIDDDETEISGCVSLPVKVLFDRNSWTIKPVADLFLPQIVEMMKRNNQLQIDIVGHTDTDGGDAYNYQLSTKRAKAVVNYLVQNGIDQRRLTPYGSGEEQPIIENGIENKAKSRRVEFCITN